MLHQLVAGGGSFSGNERHCCFLNTRSTRFANISAISGLDYKDDGRGIAITDWDLDGDQDLWIVNRSGPQVRFLRNDVPTENQFLAVHLEGQTCNRDAIGARVEVILSEQSRVSGRKQSMETSKATVTDSKLIKTLHAGDGYISQSSKWLHFGLGQEDSIDHVMVHWPGGKPETFTGLETNKRYRLVQGTGHPEPWVPLRRELHFRPSTLTQSTPDSQGRHAVSTRIPVPTLNYLTFDGTSRPILAPEGKPTLINLWASWCASCRDELTKWTDAAGRLRHSGLDILALTVDGLALGDTSGSAEAKQLLDGLEFPFRAGASQPELMEKLEILQQFYFSYQRPFSVPQSLLIDEQGRLSVIYHGTVDVDTLLADVARMKASHPDTGLDSKLFEGRWATRANYSLGELARRFSHKFPDEEIRYLRLAIRGDEAKTDAPKTSPRLLREINKRLPFQRYRLGKLLMQEGHPDQAFEECQAGLARFPENLALITLSIESLIWQGQYDRAIDSYRKALRLHPALERQTPLARLLEKSARRDKALVYLSEQTTLEPTNPEPFFRLGFLQAQIGMTDAAIHSLKSVLTLDPANREAGLGMAILLEKAGNIHGAAEQYNHLAWQLATHEEAPLRNGKAAIKLATKATQMGESHNHLYLLTLAAAYAEDGKFNRAMTTAAKAEIQAHEAGDAASVDQIKSAIKAFRRDSPYRDIRKHEERLR